MPGKRKIKFADILKPILERASDKLLFFKRGVFSFLRFLKHKKKRTLNILRFKLVLFKDYLIFLFKYYLQKLFNYILEGKTEIKEWFSFQQEKLKKNIQNLISEKKKEIKPFIKRTREIIERLELTRKQIILFLEPWLEFKNRKKTFKVLKSEWRKIEKIEFPIFFSLFGWQPKIALVKVRKKVLWPFQRYWQETVVLILVVITTVAMGFIYLSQDKVEATLVGYADPNGDSEPLEWVEIPDGDHYPTIDDGTREPDTPDTDDYIYSANNTTQDTFDMETVDLGDVPATSIKIWVYGYGEYGTSPHIFQHSATGNIYIDGSWQTAKEFDMSNTTQWYSVEFTGTFTQADVDALEVQFTKTQTAGSIGGATYIYAAYAEITYDNTAPTVSINSASQKTDGSGVVDISIEVDDANDDDTKAKIEYVSGGECDFTTPQDPTLDETEGATADFNDSGGAPSVVNTDTYQAGTTADRRIITSSGSNTVQFDWSSVVDVSSADGTYCIRVTVNDDTVDSTQVTSTLTLDNVDPTAPGALTDGGHSSSTITLAFGSSSTDTNEPVTDAYKIFYKAGSSGATRSDTEHNDANLDSYNYGGASNTTVTGLSIATQYVFNIWSYDSFGNSTTSTEVSIYTNPDNPSYLIASDPTASTMDLTWVKATEGDKTLIRRKTGSYPSSTSDGTQVYFDTGTSTTDSGLSEGNVYYYRAWAYDSDSGQYSDSYAQVNVATTGDTTAPTISSVSSSSVTQSEATITWTTDENSSSLVEYGTTTSLGSLAGDATESATSHSVSLAGLSSDTTYYYQVRSIDGSGNSAVDDNSGSYYTFTTDADTTDPTISNISADVQSDDEVSIEWQTDELADSQVAYDTSSHSGGSWGDYTNTTTLDTTLTTIHSESITGLSAETTYYYRVRSTDAAGNTATSSENSFTLEEEHATITVTETETIVRREADTTPPSISMVGVSEISQKSVKISWQSSESGNSVVSYGLTSNYGTMRGDLKANLRSHEIELTGLTPGTTYHYQVSTYDASGNRGTSTDRTFTTLRVGEEVPSEEDDDDEEETPPEEEIPSEEQNVLDKIRNASRDLFTKILGVLPDNPFISQIPEDVFIGSISEIVERAVPPPIVLSGYPLVTPESESATIRWVTDKGSNSIVTLASDEEYIPSAEEPYTIIVGNPDEQVLTHEVEVRGLEPEVLYHYQVRSRAKFSEWATSEDNTFTTLSVTNEVADVSFVSIEERQVTLRWETVLPTRTTIELTNQTTGQLIAYDFESYLKEHEVTLEGLFPQTEYTLQIFAEDETGATVSSSVLPFSTVISGEPPEISRLSISTSIVPGRVEKVQTIISWKTDKPATSRIYYEEGISEQEELPFFTPLEEELVIDHIVITTAFRPGRVYRFRAESIDAGGNRSVSQDYTILTPRPKESIIDLIVKNFSEIFGFIKNVRF